MRNNLFLLTIIIFGFLIHSCEEKTVEIQKSVLWEKGTGRYNNYRIPSLIVTQKGTLLAFCEGREAGDAGDIDI